MQLIDDAEFQLEIDLDQGARISSLIWRDMQIAFPVGGSLTGYGWSPIGAFAPGLTWHENGAGRALLDMPAQFEGATLEQRIEVLDDAIRWSLEYEPGKCKEPMWLGLNSWFMRDLERGNSADLELNIVENKLTGTPIINWEDILRVSIESDAPWWAHDVNDSEGIAITPQTIKPGVKGDGEHYIEALFVFEGQ